MKIKLLPWYANFLRSRHRRNYSYSIVGAATPRSHFKRMTRRQMNAVARRFARDGELSNAIEMLKLAYYPEQLNLKLVQRRSEDEQQTVRSRYRTY